MTDYSEIVRYSINLAGFDAEARDNWVTQWKEGFLRPVTKGDANQGYETLPFSASEEEKQEILNMEWFEAGVHGLCMAFVLVADDGAEFYECSCVSGILDRSYSQRGLKASLQEHDSKSATLNLKYFQAVFPKRFAKLRCD